MVLKSFSMPYTNLATAYSPSDREDHHNDEDKHSLRCKGAVILQMDAG